MDLYTKKYCPFCKTLNLIWLGDWSRDTGTKAEAGQCGKCDKYFLLGDQYSNKDDLFGMVSMYVDWQESPYEEMEIVDRLLSGETIVLDNEEVDLQRFLSKYPDTEKGELI